LHGYDSSQSVVHFTRQFDGFLCIYRLTRVRTIGGEIQPTILYQNRFITTRITVYLFAVVIDELTRHIPMMSYGVCSLLMNGDILIDETRE